MSKLFLTREEYRAIRQQVIQELRVEISYAIRRRQLGRLIDLAQRKISPPVEDPVTDPVILQIRELLYSKTAADRVIPQIDDPEETIRTATAEMTRLEEEYHRETASFSSRSVRRPFADAVAEYLDGSQLRGETMAYKLTCEADWFGANFYMIDFVRGFLSATVGESEGTAGEWLSLAEDVCGGRWPGPISPKFHEAVARVVQSRARRRKTR